MGKKLEIVDQVFTGEAISFSLERKRYIILKENNQYKIGDIISFESFTYDYKTLKNLVESGHMAEYNAEYISKLRDDKINDILND